MTALQKRIDRAWKNSKDWITDFDGSPTQAYLPNVTVDALPQAFITLVQESSSFRVSAVFAEDGDRGRKGQHRDGELRAEFVSPESIQDQVARLQRGEIMGLNMNYSVRLEGFDLDLHMIFNALGMQKVDLEIVWWSDQVFLDESDHYTRFETVLSYFIFLQDLFKSPKLYIGPETLEKPGPGSIDWIEV